MSRYSAVAIVLHWAIAFALAFELALGFAMPRDLSGFALFQLHKSIGITILALTLLRLGWRVAHSTPPPLESGVAARLAHAAHIGFYVLLIAVPLSGWALVSSAPAKVPTVLYGVLLLPHLPLPSTLNDAADTVHQWLAWSTAILLVLHAAAVLRHEVLLRDRLLDRMAPAANRSLALLLAGVAVVLGPAAFLTISAKMAPSAGERRATPLAPKPPALQAPSVPLSPASPEPLPTATPSDQPSATPTGAPTPQWQIAPGGQLSFAVGSDNGASITGRFTRWSGAIAFDPDRPERADIRITVDLASASVGDPTQDAMLTGGDFLAVDSARNAVFTAHSARRIAPGRYSAAGTLRLKGKTLPQAITFSLSGDGGHRRVQGSAVIDRSAYGIGQGDAAKSLAPRVTVSFSFAADEKPPAD